MVKNKLLSVLSCLIMVAGGNYKEFECNLNPRFKPIEHDSSLTYGTCRAVSVYGTSPLFKLSIKESKDTVHTRLLGERVIYNIPNLSTSSLFTHDLIDQTTPTKHTSHANTQYLQWTDRERVHFCSSIHCLTFPYQEDFYLTTSLHPIHPKCDPANLIPFLIPSNPQKLEHVCIHLNMDWREYVLKISPPARNSAYYITQTPIYELTVISHSKGKIPKEKFVGKVPKDPSHASFPCTVTLLNDYLLLNKDKLNDFTLDLHQSQAPGPGFSITGLFFPLIEGHKDHVIRTPTRVYHIQHGHNNFSVKDELQLPTYLSWHDDEGNTHLEERLILQDFDAAEFPGGVTHLPEEGRYSAVYYNAGGYEYPRAGRTITGAKALKRFLNMHKEWKEMVMKGGDIRRHPLGKYETIYYKRGETYLYSMITAHSGEDGWNYFQRGSSIIEKFGLIHWYNEGKNASNAEWARKLDRVMKRPFEFSRDWEEVYPFDAEGWFMTLIHYYSIIVASLFVLVVLVHMYSCCGYTRKRVMQVDGVQTPIA